VTRKSDGLVYSSEHGRMCPRCRKPQARCKCGEKIAARAATSSAGKSEFVYVGRESKGRKGKTVTTVAGLPVVGDELKQLAGELKRRCGTGGAVKDDVVEIQGDHRDVLVSELEARGFKVKRRGG